MKFEKKLESIVWWLIRLYPLIYVLLFCIGTSGSLANTVTDYLTTFQSFFESVFSGCAYPVIAVPLVQIMSTINGSLIGDFGQGICGYVSYLVLVELIRFIYIFFTFIFKLIRNWIEGWVK